MENEIIGNNNLNNQKDKELNHKDEEEKNLLNKSIQNLSGNLKLTNTREEIRDKNQVSNK